MMTTDRLPNPRNVRLPKDLDARLELLAERFGVTKSVMIRQAIAYQVRDWEKNGITLMPIIKT